MPSSNKMYAKQFKQNVCIWDDYDARSARTCVHGVVNTESSLALILIRICFRLILCFCLAKSLVI